MCPSRSRETRKAGLLANLDLDALLNLVLLALLVVVFYTLKTLRVPSYVLVVLTSLIISACVLGRRAISFYLLVVGVLSTSLVQTVMSLTFLPREYNFAVDVALVLVLILSFNYYMYAIDVSNLLGEFTPLLLVCSTAIGISLGVRDTVRYTILTLMDSLASSVIGTSRGGTAYKLTSSLCFCMLLYLLPIVDVKLWTLSLFAIVSATRNIFIFCPRQRWKERASYILGIDIMVKPVLVALQ